MRYPASEKLEIIGLVEQSHLGVGSTVDKLGIPKTSFYRCYDRCLAFGDAGLEDRNSSPGRGWNRIPDDVRGQSIDLAVEPYHRQTQGKIERWHQTLQNRILLENYYLPGDLDNQISACVEHYNNQRYHESIGNVTPADAYFGRHTASIEKRTKIKQLTPPNRRLNHHSQAP